MEAGHMITTIGGQVITIGTDKVTIFGGQVIIVKEREREREGYDPSGRWYDRYDGVASDRVRSKAIPNHCTVLLKGLNALRRRSSLPALPEPSP